MTIDPVKSPRNSAASALETEPGIARGQEPWSQPPGETPQPEGTVTEVEDLFEPEPEDIAEEGALRPLRPLWDDTLRALAGWRLEDQLPAQEFASRVGQRGSNPSQLRFYDWAVDRVGTLRATLIGGGRAEILNVMIFPYDIAALPVFASEIVLFGDRVQAAVVDLQPLLREPRLDHLVDIEMAALPARYQDLPSGGILPDWAQEHFTTHCLFTRLEGLELLPRLRAAYGDYLGLFLELARENPRSRPRIGGEHTALRQYKAHHIANTPGLPFLARTFGEEWTARFLREGMYA